MFDCYRLSIISFFVQWKLVTRHSARQSVRVNGQVNCQHSRQTLKFLNFAKFSQFSYITVYDCSSYSSKQQPKPEQNKKYPIVRSILQIFDCWTQFKKKRCD